MVVACSVLAIMDHERDSLLLRRAVTIVFSSTSGYLECDSWRRVIFSDESISLNTDDQRIRVRKQPAHRSDPAFVVERHTVITQCVIVWGAIRRDARSPVVILQCAIYQQDNSHPHTARLSQECLQRFGVLPWLARSPGLSSIEYVWDLLERQLQPSRINGELTAID
ncbi:DDE_3 domain-containing protein [Trichonephila clavipes]|nr:DDE_3 domain-containing protein [Trichonephila clavipes]